MRAHTMTHTARPGRAMALAAALTVALTGCQWTEQISDQLAAAADHPGSQLPTLPAGAATDELERLPVRTSSQQPTAPYDRAEHFGQDWADLDGDGCDTRQQILAADLEQVQHVPGQDCTVAAGILADPYTLQQVRHEIGPAPTGDPTRGVDIDHVVALADAWDSGADQLDTDTRQLLANDPANLLAVGASANRSKSDKTADQWLPTEAYQCPLIARQIAVKSAYGLSITAAEKQAMSQALADCPSQQLPTREDRAWYGGAERPDSTDTPVKADPSVSEPPPSEPSGCAQVWEYLGAPAVRGQDELYDPARDGDGDGVACEVDPR